MSAHRTIHSLHNIGFGVGALFGNMAIDLIAARRQDALMRQRIARRARIQAKLARLADLRSRRMAQLT